MSNEPIDYQAAEALLRAKRTPVIKPGTKLDKAFFEWCRTCEFGLVEIMSLFPKGAKSATGKTRYRCELQCPTCGTWRMQDCSKGKVSELLSAAKCGDAYRHSLAFDCAACKKAKAEERERSYDPDHTEKYLRKLKEEEKEKARERTPGFIEIYLNPRKSWNSGISQEQRFTSITRDPLDSALLSAAIGKMSKEDFRRTPYWVAVHNEAMRRAGNKCSICATPGPLTIHYRTAPRHGHEHTEEGLREILCLCERCKNTHLLKADSRNN